jgi:mono/diheme cytochrome c family protein
MTPATKTNTVRTVFVTLSPCHLVTLSLLTTVGCDLPGKPDPAERPVEGQVVVFKDLFGKNCAGCHGADGTLGPAPPLNDKLFRAGISDEDLQMTIAEGRPGTPMPAFLKKNGGSLTAAQIQILTNEIKGIPYKVVDKTEGETIKVEVEQDPKGVAPKWGVPPPLPEGAPAYALAEDGGDKERGSKAFARACAVCHGKNGQGIQKDGEVIRTLNDPAFLALTSPQALRRIAITGRPDLGMPSYDQPRPDDPHFKPLTSREITDLVALFTYWKEGGAGNGK